MGTSTRTIFQPKTDSSIVTLTFDFTSQLAAGETLSTATVTAAVWSGTDASVDIFSGSPAASNGLVTQKIKNGVLGVIYKLLASVTTSAGQTLEMAGYLAIIPDVP